MGKEKMRNTFGELLSLIKENKIEEFMEEFPGGEDLTIPQMVKLRLLADNKMISSVINEFINKKYKVDNKE